VDLGDVQCGQFKNGETEVILKESVRDCDVFLVQPTCNPCPNEYLMELLIMMDACRRGGAGRITAVIPLFGYARQDKKDKSRAPITAVLIALHDIWTRGQLPLHGRTSPGLRSLLS